MDIRAKEDSYMSSLFKGSGVRGQRPGALTLALGVLLVSGATRREPFITPHVLRVCADPNNLPFSNAKQEGFENAVARVIASELGDTLVYYWWPQRRAWVRHTIGEGKCDVAVGVPASFDLLTTTRPYYRSTYEFVSRADRHYNFHSLDDPRLRTLRIGLHFIGDDYNNPPPAHALGARGITRNVVGYSIYGNYKDPNPPARLIDAVAHGDVDVAIAWGPLAGYFAAREPIALETTAVEPAVDPRTGIQFDFQIAVGVGKGNTAFRDAIQRVLDRRHDEIDEILARYHVVMPGNRRSSLATVRGGER
jgi:mxaJ protein